MSRLGRLLNTTVNVWRTSRVPDGGGGWEETPTSLGAVGARISQPSATERLSAEQGEAFLTHVVYLDSESDVRRGDELRQAARSFDVVSVFEPSEPGTYLRADCTIQQHE